jgi:Peroxidase
MPADAAPPACRVPARCAAAAADDLRRRRVRPRAWQVGWRAGRVDAPPEAVPPNGRLPAADKGSPMATAQGLRDTFGRMGFSDQEIVALSGAHALGERACAVTGGVASMSLCVQHRDSVATGRDGLTSTLQCNMMPQPRSWRACTCSGV